ncbi:MAG: hypothetical protein AAFY72_00830 [Cyanobacteria bacterium J06649_4]
MALGVTGQARTEINRLSGAGCRTHLPLRGLLPRGDLPLVEWPKETKFSHHRLKQIPSGGGVAGAQRRSGWVSHLMLIADQALDWLHPIALS